MCLFLPRQVRLCCYMHLLLFLLHSIYLFPSLAHTKHSINHLWFHFSGSLGNKISNKVKHSLSTHFCSFRFKYSEWTFSSVRLAKLSQECSGHITEVRKGLCAVQSWMLASAKRKSRKGKTCKYKWKRKSKNRREKWRSSKKNRSRSMKLMRRLEKSQKDKHQS